VTDGPLQDKPNYVSLLKRLSAILKPMNLLLTSEGTVNKNVITRGFKNRYEIFSACYKRGKLSGIDVPQVTQYVDYYLISATDYHGPWMLITGVSTPNKEVVSF